VLRVIDSLQLTAKYSVATPVNWQHGDKVMVTPNLSDEQATEKVEFLPAKLSFGTTIASCFQQLGGGLHNAEHIANVVCCWRIHHDACWAKTNECSVAVLQGI